MPTNTEMIRKEEKPPEEKVHVKVKLEEGDNFVLVDGGLEIIKI